MLELNFADKVRWLQKNFNPYSKRWYYDNKIRTKQIFSREAKKEELRQVKVLKEQEKKQNANRNKWIGEWIKQNYGCESSKLTIEQKKEVVNLISKGKIVKSTSLTK